MQKPTLTKNLPLKKIQNRPPLARDLPGMGGGCRPGICRDSCGRCQRVSQWRSGEARLHGSLPPFQSEPKIEVEFKLCNLFIN